MKPFYHILFALSLIHTLPSAAQSNGNTTTSEQSTATEQSATAASSESADATAETEDATPTVDLDEFVITGSVITDTPQGYNIRVADQIETTAKTTMQFLDFLPNISTTKGIVEINGLQATEIRVDGHKISDISELTSIPAEMIESINVNYTAGASAIVDSPGGTIDIKLKPARNNGFYGNISGDLDADITTGLISEYISGGICAKIGKLNLYEAPVIGWTHYKEYATQWENDINSGKEFFRIPMLTESHRFNFTNRLSLSYDITSRHTLGISWRTQVYRPNADNFDETQHTLQLQSKSRYYSNNLALNYSGRLNDNGDRLTFSAEWMDYQMKQDQQFYDSPPYAGISTKERSSILQGSFDYAHPFSQSHT
ncbi:MAG: Plug domain-containing protein, partial [Muribaculaceae bacterium]|nr:Plug domain-containing protein [Muribaculaceae bacterium]